MLISFPTASTFWTLLEPLGAIVDHVVGSEFSHKADVRRRDCRGDAGTPPMCELNGEAADSAGCPVDENVLPRLNSGVLKQALPRCEAGNGCHRHPGGDAVAVAPPSGLNNALSVAPHRADQSSQAEGRRRPRSARN